jgi:hypothetical protein
LIEIAALGTGYEALLKTGSEAEKEFCEGIIGRNSVITLIPTQKKRKPVRHLTFSEALSSPDTSSNPVAAQIFASPLSARHRLILNIGLCQLVGPEGGLK